MKFASFYHNSTGYVPGTIPPVFDKTHIKPIPACGSDSILYFDGRLSIKNQAAHARETCKKRGYIGFTLHAGPSLLRNSQTRNLEIVK